LPDALFTRGNGTEEGAIGQEVTGTSRHSAGCFFDEARPKRERFVRATTEDREPILNRVRELRRQVNQAAGSLLIGELEVPMSMSYSSSTASSDVASYGGFVDALGGIATIVLAVIGLAGVRSVDLLSIATVVFGAALLIQGGAMLSEYASIEVADTGASTGGGGLASLFGVGVAGIVLGVLALLGVRSGILDSVAAIAFGGALIISASSVWALLTSRSVASRFESRNTMLQRVAAEIAAGSSGVQAMAGLAAIVLGILAVAGINTEPLALIALLVAGAAIVMTGSTLSGTMIGFMRPTGATAQVRAAP
jgi:hypothetical protein